MVVKDANILKYCLGYVAFLQVGMTKTDAAVQTLAEINPDVLLEVRAYPSQSY
jgi:hypothetical protein